MGTCAARGFVKRGVLSDIHASKDRMMPTNDAQNDVSRGARMAFKIPHPAYVDSTDT